MVKRANLGGSNAEDLVTGADGLSYPRGVALEIPAQGVPALSPDWRLALGLLLISATAWALLRRRYTA